MHLLSTLFCISTEVGQSGHLFFLGFCFLMSLAVPCLEGFVHTLDLILVSEFVIYNEPFGKKSKCKYAIFIHFKLWVDQGGEI